MKTKTSGADERLRFIEFCLFWEGEISRPRIKEQFGISSQQGSSDIKKYKESFPHNIEYSLEQRRYLKTDEFTLEYLKPASDEYLHFLESVAKKISTRKETWIKEFPVIDSVEIPSRKIGDKVFKNLISAMNDVASVEIQYTARTSTSTSIKRITPLALGNDGNRWHLRAFNHDGNRHSDYVLSRITRASKFEKSNATLKDDKVWNTSVTIQMGPHHELKQSKQDALEYEYRMKNGSFNVKCSKAMLFYYLRRYGFNPRPVDGNEMPNESSFGLQVNNFDDVMEWLEVR